MPPERNGTTTVATPRAYVAGVRGGSAAVATTRQAAWLEAPGPEVAHSCTSNQCVPVSAASHLGVGVSAVEHVMVEVTAHLDLTERDVRDLREHVERQLGLGDRDVLELEIGRELHQLGPLRAGLVAHRTS